MASHLHPLEQTFVQAMAALPQHAKVAVAFSGGLDSSVLMHLLHGYAVGRSVTMHAFHVHHGLSANADAWAEHCRTVCNGLSVPFDERRVAVERDNGTGVEEAARAARYTALGAMCTEHGVELLLTAHHIDDQAETVLLQMLRGSGIAGIAGMEACNRAPTLLGNAELVIARPLLESTRTELEDYARLRGIANIEDESNSDTRYARNALRHTVMPVLERHFPGFAARFARTARHAHAAQSLLDEIAWDDLAQCRAGDALDLERIAPLSEERADNLYRHWFAERGLRMPSTAWLKEMRSQLTLAKAEAQLCVTHPDCHVRRHRNRVYIVPREDGRELPTPQEFVWNGEASLHFPAFRGSLFFEAAQEGIAADWLRGRNCTIHLRQGGERLKLAPNRPARNLKQHFQTHDIPAWERETLPQVSSAGELLYAAGLGMDCRRAGQAGEACMLLRWQSDPIS
jgi:tRNA(Ile)-lysidine synthase